MTRKLAIAVTVTFTSFACLVYGAIAIQATQLGQWPISGIMVAAIAGLIWNQIIFNREMRCDK